jgi:hypothetical protein
VARHPGKVRKPVSIALSTQFSTRFALGTQFNERLTFWCRPLWCFRRNFHLSAA